MLPAFRSDLICSREEQQGVVFYRIDDPTTQTSFRLYEIEYLIAQKLDGTQSLTAVIDAVKNEFNFDISEPDLQRFVSQLESMGFLQAGPPREPIESETVTAVRVPPQAESLDIIEADAMVEPDTDADKAELDRLMRTAFQHVKQGYIVHARDYFLAAREISADDRLATLIRHLEIIGDASGPAEVEYLWNQACQLFPEIAAVVGPLIETKSGGPGRASTGPLPGTEDLRARVLWTLLLLAVLVGGVGALVWVTKAARIFEPAAKVTAVRLSASRVPVFFDRGAGSVLPARETWLSFGEAGRLDGAPPAVGTRVEVGQIVASLAMPPPVTKLLARARSAVTRVEQQYNVATKKLEKLLNEREALETERNAAETKLKELLPKSVLRQGGVSKRDLEKWKRAKVAANKKLTKLAQRERKPRAEVTQTEKALKQAKRQVEALEKRVALKLLRAPFSGVVVQSKLATNGKVDKAQPVVLLRDAGAVRLVYELPATAGLQVGGEAHIAVGNGTPSRAKVVSVTAKGAGQRVEVSLDDPGGGFLKTAPSEFRLVREFVEPAFEVPTSAIIHNERGTHVLIALQGRALERAVDVLQKGLATSVIRDASGALRDADQLVVGLVGEDGDIAKIAEGAPLDVRQ